MTDWIPTRYGRPIAAVLGALSLASCAPGAPMTPPAAPATPVMQRELDAEARAWVERTLASLTLRERVAQLMMPWVGGEYVALDSPEFDQLRQWVEEEGVGGLVVSVGMPHSYAAKLNAAQAVARVPLLVASDMENGPGMRMGGIYSLPHLLPQGGGTTFPPVMALGATGSDSLAYQLGRVLGREARAVGVHIAFGPVLDVNSNPLNPIINTRSLGEEPEEVARLGTAYIRGARAEGLMTTAKHFPGHGDTEVDSHLDLPFISADRERLDRVELPPFRAAVEAGVDGIMTAHVAVVGVEGRDARPATLSEYFGVQLLRDEMEFDGLLFTDALDMGAIVNRYGTAEPLLMSLDAGADVLLMPVGVSDAIRTVLAAVEGGRIAEERIDRSVRRILEAKARAGLHRSRDVDLHAVDRVVGTRPHRQVAEAVAERAITLVRDEKGGVPIDRGTSRVLAITYAEPSDLVAGREFNRALAESALRVDAVRMDARTTAAELEALMPRAREADLVVISAYVSPREYAGAIEAEGTFTQFVQWLGSGDKPVVVVSFGSPYLLSSFPAVPAYLIAWGAADVAQRAAARALLGQAAITGGLPISLPPHYALGHGIQRPVLAGRDDE